jgi:hypothetical protein
MMKGLTCWITPYSILHTKASNKERLIKVLEALDLSGVPKVVLMLI